MAIKNKYKFIRFIIMTALLFYLIYYIFISYFVKQDKTYFAAYDQMYLENEYSGLIIRNEKIFYSDISGDINYKINDGEVVKKGQVIAEIKMSKSNQVENDYLDNSTKNMMSIEDIILNIDNEIEDIKLQMVDSVSNNEIQSIAKLEEKLQLKLDLKDKLKNNKIKNYNMEEISIRNSIEGNENYFYSNYSGIVSKKFDELEKKLTMSNLYLLDYRKIYDEDINYETKISGHININENVYRIIDNYSYYVAYIIPFDDIKLFNENINKVNVEINDNLYS
ncbi:MAG: HlyD family efflux transporter periplasmic adaptor subunit, partial [Bacillota bacterium]|nr:HlyD family efflux transporter periplasmic adaptor subunit [Bacillota bacterium]